MHSTSSHTRFTVLIQGDLFAIIRNEERGTRTVCTLDRRRQPSFYQSDAGVVCVDRYGCTFVLREQGDGDSDLLLDALLDAQWDYSDRWWGCWRDVFNRRTKWIIVLFFLLLGFVFGLHMIRQGSTSLPLENSEVSLTAPRSVLPPAPLSRVDAVRPEIPSSTHLAARPASDVAQNRAVASNDGWSLPESVRATLPLKLKSAADRQLFTVNYASGHERTLYVFADPNCPNCRHLEPALVAAAHTANVVIFPVAVIGREKSIAAITPVLCLPPEQRPAAWQALLTGGTDELQRGKQPGVDKKAESACDVAEKALGVNEVAYQAYRIPGTPWVIADDGRYVPQAVLRDPAQLSQFLSRKETPDAIH